jgi:amino acid permease
MDAKGTNILIASGPLISSFSGHLSIVSFQHEYRGCNGGHCERVPLEEIEKISFHRDQIFR